MKLTPAKFARPAFTIIEVAICLAIIGIALVGIIAVLPRGLNTQRDNREETIIGQDANLLLQLISNGSRGTNGPIAPDDLTNYVYAVSNYWFFTNISDSRRRFGHQRLYLFQCPGFRRAVDSALSAGAAQQRFEYPQPFEHPGNHGYQWRAHTYSARGRREQSRSRLCPVHERIGRGKTSADQ